MKNKLLPKPIGPEQVTFKDKLIEVVEQKMRAGDYEYTVEMAKRPPGTRLIIVSPDKKDFTHKRISPGM